MLRRWNPAALTGLQTGTAGVDRPTVLVLGPRGSGRGALTARLRADAEPDAPAPDYTGDPTRPAGVTLVVLDSAAPLGREELALLDGLERAVFALTKTDVHAGWDSVLRRDAVLLAEHAPRFAGAPIHPVSAPPDGDSTGISELRGALLEALRGAPQRDVWMRRRAGVAVEQTRELVRAAASTLDHDATATDLRAQRAAVIADRDGGRADAAASLRRLVALARVDLLHEVGSRVREVGAAARTTLDRGDRAAAGVFPDHLRTEVVGLADSVDATTAERLRGMAAEVLGPDHPASAGDNPAGRLPALDPPQPRHRGVEDRLMIAVGASAGLGLGRLLVAPLSMVPTLDLASIPVTLLVGALAAWWLARTRGLAADRAHLRSWTTDALAQVRSGLEQRVLAQLVDAEARIAGQVLAGHRSLVLSTDERLATLDRRLREHAQRTSARRSACERDLAVLDRALGQPAGREPPAAAVRPTS